MSDAIIRPVTGKRCAFQTGLDPAGRKIQCPCNATLKLDTTPLCDHHAEIAMTAACGRNVKIVRDV